MQLTGFRTRNFFACIFSITVTTLTFSPFALAGDEENAGDRAAVQKEDRATRAAAEGKSLEDVTTKKVSSEVAAYTDSDHVTVFTPSVAASLENVTTGASIRGSYLVDVVSAASVDIVSTASRRWTEARQGGSLEAEYKPHDFGVSIAGSTSSEPDYFSYGFGVTMTLDLLEKNLTLIGGYGYGHDTAGRSGTPFSVFSRDINHGAFTAGLSGLVDRSTIVSGVFDLILENGDSSKPYRYIPMFSASEAAQVSPGASIDYVNAHRLTERPLEQLPLARRRFAVTGRLAHRFDDSTLRAEERGYYDTWGMLASTTDARWIFDLGRRFAVWPHTRFHVQKAVDFWQLAYVSGAGPGWDLPEYRTGDRELGPLWTFTGGGGAKVFLGNDAEPKKYAIGVSADAGYTAYTNDLYLSSRTMFLTSLMFEGEL
ncbi:MAG: DUF3570 domain-containing protein [Polyangiaceae bacterium]